MIYYPINENRARAAKRMMSFNDYKEGSATAEYRQMVDEAVEIAERQKRHVDPMYHEKIDRLLDTYTRKLADNLNQHYNIMCRCPSVMIAGPSKFPVLKQQKQRDADDRNMKEYQEIRGILDKIKGVGTGGISSDDPNALEKLEAKLADLVKAQQAMKEANAYYRKNQTLDGCPVLSEDEIATINAHWARGWYKGVPFPAYSLSNNNANMKRVRDRIEQIKKRQTETAPEGWDFDGGKVVMNTTENRLQIIFDGKPEADIRQKLKGSGFRWAPSQGAWQRQLTNNAIWDVKHIQGLGPAVKTDCNDSTE